LEHALGTLALKHRDQPTDGRIEPRFFPLEESNSHMLMRSVRMDYQWIESKSLKRGGDQYQVILEL
jgi:hypothetical protein